MTATVSTPTLVEEPRLNLKVVGAIGLKRQRALAMADEALEELVNELQRVELAGGKPNITLAANLANVSRPTVYARLKARKTANA